MNLRKFLQQVRRGDPVDRVFTRDDVISFLVESIGVNVDAAVEILGDLVQKQRLEIEEIISRLNSVGADAIADILDDLCQKKIAVDKAERQLEEARQCIQVP